MDKTVFIQCVGFSPFVQVQSYQSYSATIKLIRENQELQVRGRNDPDTLYPMRMTQPWHKRAAVRQQLFLIVTSLFINLPTSWGHWFLQGSCHRNTTPPLTSPTPLVFCAVARYCWTVVGPLYRRCHVYL